MFLVTGANGQLGQELRLILGDKAVYVDYADLDITDVAVVREFGRTRAFEAIINCAAYTAVDKAESAKESVPRGLRESLSIRILSLCPTKAASGQWASDSSSPLLQA